jgi:hypothetical protein
MSVSIGIVRPLQNPGRVETPSSGGPLTCRIQKFAVGPFGLKSFLLTQGSVLDPFYKI